MTLRGRKRTYGKRPAAAATASAVIFGNANQRDPLADVTSAFDNLKVDSGGEFKCLEENEEETEEKKGINTILTFISKATRFIIMLWPILFLGGMCHALNARGRVPQIDPSSVYRTSCIFPCASNR